MKTTFLAVTVALIATLAPASGNAATRILEDGREVTPAMLTLPSLPDGTVAIQGCGGCKRIALQLARTARFYVGKQEVSFADLKRHLQSHPEISVLVVSPKSQLIVTRIQASGTFAR